MSETQPFVEKGPAEKGPAEKAIAVRPRTEVAQFNSNDPASLFMQTNVFEQLQRVAALMANSQLVPKHLQQQQADCFLVASQAVQWKMNPFAVAQSCYVLSGKLGYEGKLIAAVVNASLRERGGAGLNYEYSGSGNARQVRVFATIKGEEKPREVIGTVGAWRTVNKQWETQIDQMLAYRGAREWARRHAPEVLLGVYAEEELPEIARSAAQNTPIEVESLGDFGTVVSASNDPQERAGKVIDAEVVSAKQEEPKKEAKKKPDAKPAPTSQSSTEAVDPDDAEIDALFSK